MKLETSMSMTSKVSRETLKNPEMGEKVQEAIEVCLRDGKIHTVGSLIGMKIIIPVHPLTDDAPNHDDYLPVGVYLVTGLQEFLVRKV